MPLHFDHFDHPIGKYKTSALVQHSLPEKTLNNDCSSETMRVGDAKIPILCHNFEAHGWLITKTRPL